MDDAEKESQPENIVARPGLKFEREPELDLGLGADAKAKAWAQWGINTLKEEKPRDRVYLSLEEAAEQLGCKPSEVWDKGIAGELALYAPVLHEGLYTWPVTERGIPFASLVGSVDGVAPIFQTRLKYGEYAILPPADIKKLKIEQAVQPQGYIFPEQVLHHLAEWEATRQEEQVTLLVRRMKERAAQVAWVPAFSVETRGGMVELDMLRVDDSDIQRLQTQSEQASNSTVHEEQESHPEVGEVAEAAPNPVQLGERRRKQIAAIEAGAKALNIDPLKILVSKPKEEKKKIREWCKTQHSELFGGGNDPFDDTWKIAVKLGVINVFNKSKFRAR